MRIVTWELAMKHWRSLSYNTRRFLMISAISLLMLAASLAISAYDSTTDFAQEYAAAWAWWNGLNPNASTRSIFTACCPEHLAAIGIRDLPTVPVQTAHPPFATLLALPLGTLPFPVARVVWLILGIAAVAVGWYIGNVQPVDYAATAGAWIYALSIGILEPFMFALLAVAIVLQQRAPLWTGALIGLAAAIKVYPLLLLAGLLIGGRWRAVLVGAVTGGSVTLLSSAIIGHNALYEWLAYTPLNTAFYVDVTWQRSLVRLVRLVVPGTPPLLATLLLAVLLTLSLLPHLRRGTDAIRPMLPVMLLASPLLWIGYLSVLALGPLNIIARGSMVVVGISGILLRLDVLSQSVPLEMFNTLLVLLTVLTTWYTWVRSRPHGKLRQVPA
jgi:hypothetical protein